MKVIIAGCRHWVGQKYYRWVSRSLRSIDWNITEVVSGNAHGIDRAGERWAKEHDVPIKPFPADWNQHGRRAGPIRNRQMADYADALVAFWDGESSGTRDMIATARRQGLKVVVFMP